MTTSPEKIEPLASKLVAVRSGGDTFPLNEVQRYLAEITFAPFWWFRTERGWSGTVRMNAKHATISSTKDFDAKGAIRVWEALSNGQATVDLFDNRGCIQIREIGNEKVGVLVQDIMDGWTVVDAWLDLPASHCTREGTLQAVQHLIRSVQDHETDEFLKVNGVHVKDPHPNGGNNFYFQELKGDAKSDARRTLRRQSPRR